MPSNTVCVRKDCLELICKVDMGVYSITNVIPLDNGQMMLIANWGRYFNRLQNPAVQLPRCKATCPTLYKLLTNSLDGINLAKKKGETAYSVYRLAPMTGEIPLLSITKELFEINSDFVNTMIGICNEISNNPPFPAWKDGLDELWN